MIRSLVMGLCWTLLAAAQIDPDYQIPKANPHTSPDDVKRGQQLFMGHCASCHGPKGEGGRGVPLAQPRLRRAADDESLFRVIRDGVPGTEMPAGWVMTSREIWQVAGYVRSLGRTAPESVPGDPARGKILYETKGQCTQCHLISGQGSGHGPELTEIGARRSASYLRAALVDPEAAVPEGFLQVRVVTPEGRTITGVRLNEDTFSIQLREVSGAIHSFFKQDLKELHKDRGKSPMPSYKAFPASEIDDLVAYLASLRGEL
jgi:cytochrome c oxidase cbb3-type subunit 3